ncbi:RNase3 domain-containing protein [Ceratocystis lukuohia]|uniref:RNase3 domain-containing protein n=1 Tax=Ceratocystis lukuohia TaxID=2019550 RepID=A0ABR4MKH9_9PEZI
MEPLIENDVFHHELLSSESEDEDILEPPLEALAEPSQSSPSESLGRDLVNDHSNVNDESVPFPKNIAARAYQLEMYHSSLEKNTIVTMAWFLAPTASLCMQQHEVISAQIPSVKTKIMLGTDSMDSWSTKARWSRELEGVRIVVCTHQILLDALDHSFVDLDDMSLIIFDEAHNCVGNHPGSKIMRCHYHTRKAKRLPVPAILGLSASPSMNAMAKTVEQLEDVMDAVCKTPVIHREELIAHSNRPTLTYLAYPNSDEFGPTVPSKVINSLRSLFANYKVAQDPYVSYLRSKNSEAHQFKLKKLLQNNDSYCQRQIRAIIRRSEVLRTGLGVWASEYYICATFTSFFNSQKDTNRPSSLKLREDEYLQFLAKDICLEYPQPEALLGPKVSPKFQSLLDYLMGLPEHTKGIIFANQRSVVAAIAHVLSIHPDIKKAKHNVRMVVGTTKFRSATDTWDLATKNPLRDNALTDFRSGKANILVATSVLEEGIDVPACNLVVCFDSPPDFKSFIQRRGRARSKESSLILLVSDSELERKDWEAQEELMKSVYMDEQRQLNRLAELEQMCDEDELERLQKSSFIVPDTGARLDMESAISHLYHFCAILGSNEFIDSRPNFIYEEVEVEDKVYISATVILPSFLPLEHRKTKSRHKWQSQKNAAKDASFCSYIKLHEAGLVNDHLLPFKVEEFSQQVETCAAVSEVSAIASPWPVAAELWKRNTDRLWTYRLQVKDSDSKTSPVHYMTLPEKLPLLEPITLYPQSGAKWIVEISESQEDLSREYLEKTDHTIPLLTLAHGYRKWIALNEARTSVVKFSSPERLVKMSDISSSEVTLDFIKSHRNPPLLVRDSNLKSYIFKEYLEKRPPWESVQKHVQSLEAMPENVPYLALKPYPKRTDLLHPMKQVQSDAISRKRFNRVFPVSFCKTDDIPVEYMTLGMMIPCIIHDIEVRLLVKHLCETILSPVQFVDLRLVREAMSSRAASEPMNYERIEFLGDSILKFMTSTNVCAQKLEWPEGYLTFFKDSIVSNSRLQRICIQQGLAKYILTKPFTGRKWTPIYIEDNLDKVTEPETRILSTKTLADFVEALIGASFLDGGLDRTLVCLNTLWKGDYVWREPHICREILFEATPLSDLPHNLYPLETLLGYTFTKKALLMEAVTHTSFLSAESWERSMERLEFLGDAVLDEIIVKRLYAIQPPLTNSQLHTMKTSLVNGDFLAWLSLSYTVTSSSARSSEPQSYSMWQFMRYTSPSLAEAMHTTNQRFRNTKDDIGNDFKHGRTYPWAKLARLQAKKFYSDMFEAIMGAIYIDSGSTAPCERFLKAMGVFDIMERMIRDKVRVSHPKELLAMKAGNNPVAYIIDKGVGDDAGAYRCQLMVGDECWADISDGVNPEEAKVSAAFAALDWLEQRSQRS